MKLAGCTAVITGASRGIGLGIAQALSHAGTNAVLIGRNQKTLQAAKETLSIISDDQQHKIHAMDVSQSAHWDDLMKGLSDVKILVNAAGITHYSLLPRTPVSTVNDILATNLAGAIYGSRVASKSMLRTGGCIINISSALAHRGGSGSSVYAASKAGLIGFTKALAQELGPRGVRCNAISPGYVETDMVSGMSLELRRTIIGNTGLKRMGKIHEIAHAAMFVLENDFLNGSTITIDGGLAYD